jgi:hypothetical protein
MHRRIAALVIPLGFVGLLTGCSTSDSPSGRATTPQAEFRLTTHCGVDDLQLDGEWYERVGGKLDDGTGNPPPGWTDPFQVGRIDRVGDQVVFTDSAGHRETFQPRPAATGPKQGCA